MRRTAGILWLLAATLAGCTGTPPAGTASADTGTVPPAAQPQGEFPASHHAVVEGTVTSRGGTPLDSVTVVAWRVDRGSVLQLREVTGRDGRFRLPVQASVGTDPSVRTRVVIRGFAYASRYPRGPGGSVALDSTMVDVTMVPMGQAAPVARASLTLPLP